MQVLQMKVKFTKENREKCLFLANNQYKIKIFNYSRVIKVRNQALIGSIIHDIPEGNRDCFNHLRHNTNNICGDMGFLEFFQNEFTQLQGKIKKKYPNIYS